MDIYSKWVFGFMGFVGGWIVEYAGMALFGPPDVLNLANATGLVLLYLFAVVTFLWGHYGSESDQERDGWEVGEEDV